MANFLASIFGTELDKVNCSFYFVSPPPSVLASRPNTLENINSPRQALPRGSILHG